MGKFKVPYGRQSSIPTLDRPHAIQLSKTKRNPCRACCGLSGLMRCGWPNHPRKPGLETYETDAAWSIPHRQLLKESWRFIGKSPRGLRNICAREFSLADANQITAGFQVQRVVQNQFFIDFDRLLLHESPPLSSGAGEF